MQDEGMRNAYIGRGIDVLHGLANFGTDTITRNEGDSVFALHRVSRRIDFQTKTQFYCKFACLTPMAQKSDHLSLFCVLRRGDD